MTTRRLFLSLIPAAPFAWLFGKQAEAQEVRPRFHITLSPNAKIIQAAVERVERKYQEKIDELERREAEHRAKLRDAGAGKFDGVDVHPQGWTLDFSCKVGKVRAWAIDDRAFSSSLPEEQRFSWVVFPDWCPTSVRGRSPNLDKAVADAAAALRSLCDSANPQPQSIALKIPG